MKQICFFEDEQCNHLNPLILTRPADHLRIGILKICEKWKELLHPDQVTRLLRPELKNLFPAPALQSDNDCLWINARFLPDTKMAAAIDKLDPDEGYTSNGAPVIIKLSGEKSCSHFENRSIEFNDVSFRPLVSGSLLTHVTDIFQKNGDQITNDWSILNLPDKTNMDVKEATVFGDHPVYAKGNVTIEPDVTFITTDGPVYLGEDATVMAGAVVRGPVVLGDHSYIKMNAKIYGETTIGPHSKVGGELHNVVIQGYSNKAHDGFLGNSVIGEWCNFGADTNNSNLKNNYSTVRLTDWPTRETVDTGLQFCGTIMGDHCKTAINTNINTGSVFGVCCNIVTASFPPKFLPSYSWLTDKGNHPYDLDKAIETAEMVMKRRNVAMTDEYRALMKYLFGKR
ncbi:MAG TPA: putative sugar nucleotidyl transferase [Balneolales bacterium]|nr:putative sugar nucleotidyl transferase [Balneolales bacterium]